MDFIPYSTQSISEDDVAAVLAVLKGPFLTQGPTGPAFEAAFADRHGVAHGIGVSSATAGLHIACLALGVGPDSRVWTSPNSFLACSDPSDVARVRRKASAASTSSRGAGQRWGFRESAQRRASCEYRGPHSWPADAGGGQGDQPATGVRPLAGPSATGPDTAGQNALGPSARSPGLPDAQSPSGPKPDAGRVALVRGRWQKGCLHPSNPCQRAVCRAISPTAPPHAKRQRCRALAKGRRRSQKAQLHRGGRETGAQVWAVDHAAGAPAGQAD